MAPVLHMQTPPAELSVSNTSLCNDLLTNCEGRNFNLLQMQAAYDEYNDHAKSSGKSRGHFVVDLCRPGHLTICLRNFQERIKCNDDNWDAQFGKMTIMIAAYTSVIIRLECQH